MSSRTIEQKFDLLVTAIKANQSCRNERQNFSTLRATTVGRHIEPQIAKDAAISLVDCFQRLHLNPLEAEKRKIPVQCLKSGGHCEKQIQQYLNPSN